MSDDIKGKGGGGENWRVEPGGKGCAIIRSLRGGMHSVVETLSLRIRAEPPTSPVATEGGLRENIFTSQIQVRKCSSVTFFHRSVSLTCA